MVTKQRKVPAEIIGTPKWEKIITRNVPFFLTFYVRSIQVIKTDDVERIWRRQSLANLSRPELKNCSFYHSSLALSTSEISLLPIFSERQPAQCAICFRETQEATCILCSITRAQQQSSKTLVSARQRPPAGTTIIYIMGEYALLAHLCQHSARHCQHWLGY